MGATSFKSRIAAAFEKKADRDNWLVYPDQGKPVPAVAAEPQTDLPGLDSHGSVLTADNRSWLTRNIVEPAKNIGRNIGDLGHSIAYMAGYGDEDAHRQRVSDSLHRRTSNIFMPEEIINEETGKILAENNDARKGMHDHVKPVTDGIKNVGRSTANGINELLISTPELLWNSTVRGASQVPKALNWVVGNGYKSDWADRVRDRMYMDAHKPGARSWLPSFGGTAEDTALGADTFWDYADKLDALSDFNTGIYHGFANAGAGFARGVGNVADAAFDAPEFKDSANEYAEDILDVARDSYRTPVFEDSADFRKATEALGLGAATAATAGAGKVLGAAGAPVVRAAAKVPVAGKVLAPAAATAAGALATAPAATFRAGVSPDEQWRAEHGATQYVTGPNGTQVPYSEYDPNDRMFRAWDNLMLFGGGGPGAAAGNFPGMGFRSMAESRDAGRNTDTGWTDDMETNAIRDYLMENYKNLSSDELDSIYEYIKPDIDQYVAARKKEFDDNRMSFDDVSKEVSAITNDPAAINQLREIIKEETGEYPTNEQLEQAIHDYLVVPMYAERGYDFDSAVAHENLRNEAMTDWAFSLPVGAVASKIPFARVAVPGALGLGAAADFGFNDGKVSKNIYENGKEFARFPFMWLHSWGD